MSAVDWLIVIGLVLSVVGAAAHGFFREAFSLGGAIVGFLVAAWQCQRVANSWLAFMNPRWAADAVAFFMVFVGIALLAGVVGRITSWTIREAGLGWVDRVLGAAFGLVRGLFVATVAVVATTAFTPDAHWLARSSLAPYFLVVGKAATWVTPADIRNRVRQGIDVLERAKIKAEGTHAPADPSGTRRAAAGPVK